MYKEKIKYNRIKMKLRKVVYVYDQKKRKRKLV